MQQQQQQQGLLKIYKYETNVDILLYEQCNQMLQWKVAQFLFKSCRNNSHCICFFLKVTFFKIAQKIAQNLGNFC